MTARAVKGERSPDAALLFHGAPRERCLALIGRRSQEGRARREVMALGAHTGICGQGAGPQRGHGDVEEGGGVVAELAGGSDMRSAVSQR